MTRPSSSTYTRSAFFTIERRCAMMTTVNLPLQSIDAVLNVLRPERSEEVLLECALSEAKK